MPSGAIRTLVRAATQLPVSVPMCCPTKLALSVRQRFDRIRRAEVTRASGRPKVTQDDQKLLEDLSRNLVEALLQSPTERIHWLSESECQPDELARALSLVGILEEESA